MEISDRMAYTCYLPVYGRVALANPHPNSLGCPAQAPAWAGFFRCLAHLHPKNHSSPLLLFCLWPSEALRHPKAEYVPPLPNSEQARALLLFSSQMTIMTIMTFLD